MFPGIAPVRLFLERFRTSRRLQWVISIGMEPVRLFPEKSRTFRRVNWLISIGMGPESVFEESSRCCKLDNWPISGPTGPEMPRLDKLRENIFWVLLHFTPFHEQGVSWEEFQLYFTDFGTTHLFRSEIKAFPSEFKADNVQK